MIPFEQYIKTYIDCTREIRAELDLHQEDMDVSIDQTMRIIRFKFLWAEVELRKRYGLNTL